MKKQFCTYEISKELKELNFDEECLAYYCKEAIYEDKDGNKTNFVLLSAKKRGELVGHGSVRNYLFQWLLNNDKTHGELHTLSQSIAAPLWQQAIDWFREKYKINIFFDCEMNGCSMEVDWFKYKYKIYVDRNWVNKGIYNSSDSYIESRKQAILKAIEIIKNNK